MDLTEKIAYIKGLAEGLSLDESKPEVKIINAIIDLLDDIAYDVQDMEELYDDLSAQVDEIDQDLAAVESELFDEDGDSEGLDDEDDYEDYFDDDDVFYEVTCDSCGQTINISEDVLLEGEIECPNCGETIEFDFSNLFKDKFADAVCDYDCESCSSKDVCDKEPEDDAEEKAE